MGSSRRLTDQESLAIRSWIDHSEKSYREFTTYAGYHHTTFSKVYNGKVNLTKIKAKRLYEKLNELLPNYDRVSIDFLLDLPGSELKSKEDANKLWYQLFDNYVLRLRAPFGEGSETIKGTILQDLEELVSKLEVND